MHRAIDLNWRRRIAAACLLAGVAGCATLPAEEATSFRKLASAKQKAFASLTQAESDAATAFAVHSVADEDGEIEMHDCGATSAKECTLTFKQGGARVDPGVPAVNTRRLIAAIADYGDRMADLAEAKDIDELTNAARAAGSAVNSLASAVSGVPALGGVVELGALAYRGKLVEKRRQLLLEIATRAKAPIDLAARNMHEIGEASAKNIAANSAQNVRAAGADLLASRRERELLDKRAVRLKELVAKGSRWAETTLDTVEQRQRALRDERAGQVTALIESARALNAAKTLDIDFGKLSEAHDALIDKLAYPNRSAKDSLAAVNAFLDALEDLSTVGKDG